MDYSGRNSYGQDYLATPRSISHPYPTSQRETTYSNGEFARGDEEKGFESSRATTNVNEREAESGDSRRSSISLQKQESHAHGHGHDDGPRKKLTIRERIHHFTWAWYTLTMSTGGLATLIILQPHSFPALFGIGMFFYILNIILFTLVTTTLVYRFFSNPGDLSGSIKHEREGLFIATFFLTVATIITGTHKYVIQPHETPEMKEWLLTSITVAYWAYFVLTFILAIAQYSFLFAGHTYLLTKMMPSWLLPIFPVMLTGTIASVIAADLPMSSRGPVLVGGMAAQGLGFFVAMFMYAHYIGRLMQSGLPNREHRPGMFIGVGPPSFTALAFIGMSRALPAEFNFDGDMLIDVTVIRIVAVIAAIFLWLLAAWFFMIAAIAVVISTPKYFHLGWWAMVFPNSGFTIATIQIANSLNSESLRFVGNGMTIALVLMWAFVLYNHIRAVVVVDIMYPGRDEDVDD